MTGKTGKRHESQSVPPGRIFLFGSVAFVLIVVLSLAIGTSMKERLTGSALLSQEGPATGTISNAPSASHTTDPDDPEGGQLIRSIQLTPPQPTRRDTLRAEVIPAVSDAGRLAYTYTWKVNDQIIPDATGDALDLANLRRMDLVSVNVTPYDGEKAGFAVNSPLIAIYSVAPSLELKTMGRKIKAGEPLVLQLSSIHPETEEVTFSLESPSLPGMTIDSKTGKITWILQPGQEGTMQFGASVSDTETKVTRVFDVNIGNPVTEK